MNKLPDNQRSYYWQRLWLIMMPLLLAGCMLQPLMTVTPLPTVPPADPTALPQLDSWAALAPGMERRVYVPNGNTLSQIMALRIDPSLYTFRVHYRPGQPLNVLQWRDELTGTVALLNANFFDPQQLALGLVVTDGVIHGQPYTDRGGLFAVQNGQPRVRSNVAEPYTGEPLEQAIQAFPMLVHNGQQAYTNTTGDRVTRRTAIGQDVYGRIVLLATPLVGLTLADLSAFLVTSDLELVNAFNLDGGGSTMLLAVSSTGISDLLVTSRDPVPAVLSVYPR